MSESPIPQKQKERQRAHAGECMFVCLCTHTYTVFACKSKHAAKGETWKMCAPINVRKVSWCGCRMDWCWDGWIEMVGWISVSLWAMSIGHWILRADLAARNFDVQFATKHELNTCTRMFVCVCGHLVSWCLCCVLVVVVKGNETQGKINSTQLAAAASQNAL